METDNRISYISDDEQEALGQLVDLAIAELQYNDDTVLMRAVERVISMQRRLGSDH